MSDSDPTLNGGNRWWSAITIISIATPVAITVVELWVPHRALYQILVSFVPVVFAASFAPSWTCRITSVLVSVFLVFASWCAVIALDFHLHGLARGIQ